LGRFRTLLLSVRPTLNFGHASGTLRFGTDPSISVLDANCKAHDLANLYVTDASFLPTSMGVNPSLVIAANALRVADIIAAQRDVFVRRAS
jgi:choline dehydrogenase-like flavoprotein